MDTNISTKEISKNYQNNWNIGRITKVKYMGGYKLKITFENNTTTTINFEPYLKQNPLYKPYLNIKKFLTFYIEDNGALHWKGNNLDFHYTQLLNWK